MNMIWHHHGTKPSDTKLTGFILFYWSQAEYAKSRNQRYEQNQRRMRFWAFGGYESWRMLKAHSALGIPRVAFCIG